MKPDQEHESWIIDPEDSAAMGRPSRTEVCSFAESAALLETVEDRLQQINNFDPSGLPKGALQTAAQHEVERHIPRLLRMSVQLAAELGQPIPEQAAEWLRGETR